MKTNLVLLSFLICMLVSLQTVAQTYQEQHAVCAEPFQETGSATPSQAAAFNECMAGATAPDFSVTTLTGENLTLAGLRGKVVVLNFWSTTCKPCIEEMPALNELVQLYKQQDVVFISLAPESATTLQSFFQKHPFAYTPAANTAKIKSDVFKLQGVVPYSVIIDRQGKIKKMWFGAFPEREKIFSLYTPLIDECLAKN